MIKQILLIGILLVITGCGLTEKQCKEIAMNELESWKDSGYRYGYSACLDRYEEEYKSKTCVQQEEGSIIELIKHRYFIEGISVKDIAKEFGIVQSTVYDKLQLNCWVNKK